LADPPSLNARSTDVTTTTTQAELVDLIRRGRRAKTRSQGITKFIGTMLMSAVSALSGGFNLMLAVGVAHAEWVPPLPTIGYWRAVLLVFLLRGTFSAIKSTDKESS